MSVSKTKKSFLVSTLVWLIIDAALCNVAMILAQQLRFDVSIPQEFFARYVNIAPVMTALALVSFWAFGLYRNMWQYANASSVLQIIIACFVATLAIYAYSLIRYSFTQPVNYHLLHRSVYVLYFIMLTGAIGASRLLYRVIATRGYIMPHRPHSTAVERRTLIVGAGWAGASIVHEIQLGRYGNCLPVIAVDDDPQRIGAKLNGIPVLEDTKRIAEYAAQYDIDDIIIAIATPNGDVKPLVERCLATGCRVKRVTSLQEIDQAAAHSTLRDVDISDLLGRPEEQLDMTRAAATFRGRTVLITGGGGSIGSEMCRQILAFQPKQIVLYDISENYIYDLFFEMQERYPKGLKDVLILCVGSIQDSARLSQVMDEYHPEIVIHAAAHKHVPLMEDCPAQAVKNNVFGTYNVARVAIDHGVKRFVMISTDKAVNPTNVMGATKRLAEKLVEALNTEGKTEFMAVRFGNVLGSHGSVVPLFKRQILSGGPVTLTHPDIIRYFMTIPEAASLVLQAASIAKGGELFVLDMGQPMKIRELAEHMIQLYTAQGGKRVDIVYTGLRPGEKLYEELLMKDEDIVRTEMDKVFITQPDIISLDEMRQLMDALQTCLDAGGDMRACLHELLPSYHEADEVNAEAIAQHKLDAAEHAQEAAGA